MKTFWKILLSIIPAAGVLLHLVFIVQQKQLQFYDILVSLAAVGLFYLSVRNFPTIRRSAYRLIGWASIIFLLVPFSAAIMILAQYPTMTVQQRELAPLGIMLIGVILLIYSVLPGLGLGIIALFLRQWKKKVK